MKIRFWGVRGSIPTSDTKTMRYGGDTTCIEIQAENQLIILDAGSGIRQLGRYLIAKAHHQPITGHIFITHTHWDHIQGFPFFYPAFVKKNTFIIYGPHYNQKTLEGIFTGQMKSEYFPISIDSMASKPEFVSISEETIHVGNVAVSSIYVNHPEIALGYRVDYDNKSIVFSGDHEPYSFLHNSVQPVIETEINNKTNPAELQSTIQKLDQRLSNFAQDTDMLIFDTAYTYDQYRKSRQGWGHGYPEYAVKIANQAGAKCLVLTHHDPTDTDILVDAKTLYTRRLIAQQGSNLKCFGAKVGAEIDLNQQ
jgi:phosphoribosyl 1,2-cyclic phosphodiesterase